MGAFVEGVGWLERQVKVPRYGVATFLVITAIAGAWLAPLVVPGW